MGELRIRSRRCTSDRTVNAGDSAFDGRVNQCGLVNAGDSAFESIPCPAQLLIILRPSSACSSQHGCLPAHREDLGPHDEHCRRREGLAVDRSLGHLIWVRGGGAAALDRGLIKYDQVVLCLSIMPSASSSLQFRRDSIAALWLWHRLCWSHVLQLPEDPGEAS